MSKTKKDKQMVKVYYRVVVTSPLQATIVVVNARQEPETTKMRAEELLIKKGGGRIQVICSDFYDPKEEKDEKAATNAASKSEAEVGTTVLVEESETQGVENDKEENAKTEENVKKEVEGALAPDVENRPS